MPPGPIPGHHLGARRRDTMHALLRGHGIHDVIVDAAATGHDYLLFSLAGILVLPPGLDRVSEFRAMDAALEHQQALQQQLQADQLPSDLMSRGECPRAAAARRSIRPQLN